ncbi:MAG: DUF2304 domain-containing protein [Actinobacteria bacterium]|nr:DUF2304 domain-containing protein [Actinomycetota bacterium]
MEFEIKNILGLAASVIFLVYLIYLIKNSKLKEEYSFLWIAVGIVMIIISIFPQTLNFLRRFLGFSFIENILYFFSLFFLLVLSLQMTVQVSRLSNQAKTLAQKLALLEEKLNKNTNPTDNRELGNEIQTTDNREQRNETIINKK